MRKKRGRRYWRNIAIASMLAILAGVLFFFYVGHPFFLSDGYTHPKRLAVCCETPADRGLSYEDASFVTPDGLTLRGWYIHSKNDAAVVLLHGLASNRLSLLDVAAALARHGYGVLLFDLRAHGDSEGELLPFGGNEVEDVRAAVDYLQRRADVDSERIGALGWSLGAQTSLLAAARDDAIKAVVADAPCCTTFQDWPPPRNLGEALYVPYDLVFYQFLKWRTGVTEPVSVRDAMGRIAPRPILLIGGGIEQYRLEYLLAAAGEPKSLWIIPEAGHIQGFSLRPQEYEERMARFFDQALLGE